MGYLFSYRKASKNNVKFVLQYTTKISKSKEENIRWLPSKPSTNKKKSREKKEIDKH